MPGWQHSSIPRFPPRYKEIPDKVSMVMSFKLCFKLPQVSWSELFATLLKTGRPRNSTSQNAQAAYKIETRVCWPLGEAKLSFSSKLISLEILQCGKKWVVEVLNWERKKKCPRLFIAEIKLDFTRFIPLWSGSTELFGSLPSPRERFEGNERDGPSPDLLKIQRSVKFSRLGSGPTWKRTNVYDSFNSLLRQFAVLYLIFFPFRCLLKPFDIESIMRPQTFSIKMAYSQNLFLQGEQWPSTIPIAPPHDTLHNTFSWDIFGGNVMCLIRSRPFSTDATKILVHLVEICCDLHFLYECYLSLFTIRTDC